MIAARVLDPQSKLATTRSWEHSTLGELFGVSDADENELYAALDWLRERQPVIEQRLAKRHLRAGAPACRRKQRPGSERTRAGPSTMAVHIGAATPSTIGRRRRAYLGGKSW